MTAARLPVTVDDPQQLRRRLGELPRPLGLVPTMGNLHRGHLDLVRASRSRDASTVVSIFVNPLQFGPGEDFSAYPRTLEADLSALAPLGVDVVFAPTPAGLYPDGQTDQTRIVVPGLTAELEGASRPGHFDGVATVVCKLFGLCQPDRAYFGAKDFQQLQVIRKFTRELDIPVSIVSVPIARDDDGLALSSRNQYLTTEQRRIAPRLHTELQRVADRVLTGESDFRALEDEAMQRLAAHGFEPDYVSIRCSTTLRQATDQSRLVILAAARLGRPRLLDNIEVNLT